MSWVDELLEFEAASPSPQHLFSRVQRILSRKKFERVEDGKWPQGKGYALMGKAIAAYNVKGKKPSIVYVACSDRPCLIVRVDWEKADGIYNFVRVERGTATDTCAWGDRDLRAAGMVGGALYDSEKGVCCVPTPSHGFTPEYAMHEEQHFMPLVGVSGSLKDVLGVDPAGLRLIDSDPAQVVGADKQLICGSGIGDVAGAFVAARAFAASTPRDGECNFLVVYDGIEKFDVEGALRDVAQHVFGERDGVFDDALCVRFGAVPAFHPNFQDASDEGNCARIGSGIALVDGLELTTRVVVERAAAKLGIPLQKHAAKQEAGKQEPVYVPEYVARMGMRFAHVGVPALGVNGVRQTVAIRDIDSLVRFADEVAENGSDHRLTL